MRLPKVNLERKSRIVIGILGILTIFMYLLTTANLSQYVLVTLGIAGIFAGLFLWSEGAIVNYFQTKKYKSFSFGDIVVWASLIVGTAFIINSLLIIIPSLSGAIPNTIENFVKGTTITTGLIGLVLFVIHIASKKFE